MTTVAGYFRVSRARDDMQAPAIYKEQIERYCAYRGLELAELYSDIDYSAFREAKPRPGLDRLVGERHRYQQIVVPKLSRFGRSMKDLVRLFELFDQDRIGLVFLDLNIDTKTSQGRLLRNVMSAFAEYESDVKSDYSRASHRRVAELGRPVASCIYGYRYDKAVKNYVVVDYEADVVRRVYAMYLEGMTVTAIAKRLNDEGIPTKRGVRWCHNRVVGIVDNPTYAGMRVYKAQTYQATWEALVSHDQWEKGQQRRNTERRNYGPTNQRYLLSGLIACECCGRALHHHRFGGKSPRYVCDSSRRTGKPCPGGGITEALADRLVTDAYLTRVEQLGGRVLGESAADVGYRDQWGSLSAEDRNRLLRNAIGDLELIARSIRKAPGQDRFRQLRLTWKPAWRLRPDEIPTILRVAAGNSKVCARCGYRRDLAMFLAQEFPDGWCRMCRKRYKPTGSPVGRSWAEWRQEQLLFRSLRVDKAVEAPE